MGRHNKIIHGCSLRSIFKRPFKQWLRQWKPLHLCWLFEKLNLPIPKYFIGGGDGPPVFSGGNIDNATRNLGNTEDVPVTGWNKANLFIVALAWETAAGKRANQRTYYVQWRNKTDSGAWDYLGAQGVVNWGMGGTDLEEGNELIESEAICSSINTTFVNNIEQESNNIGTHAMINGDEWTERQWAVEAYTALNGKEYEFRLWNETDTVVVGTSLATITFAAPPTYQLSGVTKDKDGNTKGTCKCFLCKDNGDNTSTYVAYTVSDGSGNYSFTGLTDNDAAYFVISWKDDTPHVFDVTDHVLQPTSSDFPTGWGRRCELKIQASKVSENLSNFPVLLTLSTFPSEMFDADGANPALAGGGDIRFSSDQAGSTSLACEIVTFTIDNDPANGVAEIWVSVPSVSSSVDTSIWVWYDKDAESQPGEAEAYGKHATWDDGGNDYFKLVQHLDEDPTSNGDQAIDSTQYSNDGASTGSMNSGDLATGAFAAGTQGDGWEFDGGDDWVNFGNDGTLTVNNITVSAWVNPTVWETSWIAVVSKQDTDSPYPTFDLRKNGSDPNGPFEVSLAVGAAEYTCVGNSVIAGNWQQIAFSYDGETILVYNNGTQTNSETGPSGSLTGSPTIPVYAAENPSWGGRLFTGVIDEIRISSIARSASWMSSSYNNQDDPATFVLEQTPESP